MTQPMQRRKRFIFFTIFLFLFLALIPVVILYSTGYRLGHGLKIESTGGLYVFYPESGAKLFIDGKPSEETTLFSRGLFIDNLAPTTYNIEVTKDGYIPWKKSVEIKEKRVSEAYPFFIPEVISTSTVSKFITLTSGASITSSLYTDVVNLFASSTSATSTATSTTTKKTTLIKTVAQGTTTPLISTSTALLSKNIEIDIDGNNIVATWKGDTGSTPFYFCDPERLACQNSFIVKTVSSTKPDAIKNVEFYPGRNDVVLYNTKDGLYVTELDTRPPQNTLKLVSGNINFDEMNDRVFIQDKNSYYELLFTSSTTANAISI